MSDRDRYGSFLFGFIAGGLIGAVVALLYAPTSGEETRAEIRERSIELRDQARMAAEEAMARAERGVAEARARAEELARQLRERGQEAADEVRSRSRRDASGPTGTGDGPPA